MGIQTLSVMIDGNCLGPAQTLYINESSNQGRNHINHIAASWSSSVPFSVIYFVVCVAFDADVLHGGNPPPPKLISQLKLTLEALNGGSFARAVSQHVFYFFSFQYITCVQYVGAFIIIVVPEDSKRSNAL